MEFIKEPKEIDFVIDSDPLTEKDRQLISDIIADYKLTGRKRKSASFSNLTVTSRKNQRKQNPVK